MIHNRKLPRSLNLYSNKLVAPLAQWIRRLPTEQEILGSIPGGGSVDLNFVIHQTSKKKLNFYDCSSKLTGKTGITYSSMLWIVSSTWGLKHGRLAQMVERSLSMREAPGSIPGLSSLYSRCLRLRRGGAMVARSTPDRKVGGSIPSRVTSSSFLFCFHFFHVTRIYNRCTEYLQLGLHSSVG